MENKFIKQLLETDHPVETDGYPVEFDEGVDFMGTGITVHNFGEIFGCCSESLAARAEEDAVFALSIWDMVRRFLTGDFGDVSPDEARRASVDFHEGLPVLCKYKNYHVSEGQLYLAVEEIGHPENPRFIYVLLPSEQKAVEEWYERHPEEQVDNFKGIYSLLINLN